MVRYIVFVIDAPRNAATEIEMAAIDKFNAYLRDNRHWVTAAGISGAESIYLIDNRENRNQIQLGSLVNSSENYTGFWIIEADSDEHALELAKEASRACNRRVEVRPYLR